MAVSLGGGSMDRRRQSALITCSVGLAAILAGLALQNANAWTARAELWAALLAGVGSGLVAVAIDGRHEVLKGCCLT